MMEGPETSAKAVSCVTVFYNRGWLVADSVGSLLAQSFDDMEVVVVNDGSTDDTAERLDAIRDPRLRVIHQPNSGFTVAMNRAIRASSGRYVAVHGAGDISLPERIATQARYLDAHPAVGATGCVREAEGFVIGPKSEVERGPMLATMLDRNPFSHGEVMFRRALYDRVGGYREAFRFAQDRDLWLRMGAHCDYAVLPELLYRRGYFPGGVTKTPRHLYLQTKLSQFAVQCARERMASGSDLLERLGPSAFFLTRPTRSLSHKYTLWGLRALRDGETEAADLFLSAGVTEHRNLRSIAGGIMHRLARVAALRWLIVAGLRAFTPRREGWSGVKEIAPAARLD
jgi:glycosyltransferase involved in cell wall biosynthesis